MTSSEEKEKKQYVMWPLVHFLLRLFTDCTPSPASITFIPGLGGILMVTAPTSLPTGGAFLLLSPRENVGSLLPGAEGTETRHF